MTKKTTLQVVATGKPPRKKPLDTASAVNAEPVLFNINMDEVLHLTGDSAANGDNSDPVVISGSAELALRQLSAEFGFDRLPTAPTRLSPGWASITSSSRNKERPGEGAP